MSPWLRLWLWWELLNRVVIVYGVLGFFRHLFFSFAIFFFFLLSFFSLHTNILALPEYLLSNALRTSSVATLVIGTVIILDHSTVLELCSFLLGFYMLENGMQITGESLIFYNTNKVVTSVPHNTQALLMLKFPEDLISLDRVSSHSICILIRTVISELFIKTSGMFQWWCWSLEKCHGSRLLHGLVWCLLWACQIH